MGRVRHTIYPYPADYDALAAMWPTVERVIAAAGVPAQDVKDVSQSVFEDVLARDKLAEYDPTLAPFNAFIFGYVSKRCRGYRATAWANQADLTREALPDRGAQDSTMDFILSLDRIVEFERWLRRRDERLADLLIALIAETITRPAINRHRIARKLGCSVSTVNSLIPVLRETATNWGLGDAE